MNSTSHMYILDICTVSGVTLFSACVLAFGLGRMRGWPQIRRQLASVQATHLAPTLRLGGISVLLGYLALLALTTSGAGQPMLVGISLVPVFVIALLEDLHVPMSPRRRLLSVFLSCLIEIWLRGAWMPRFDIAGLDAILGLGVVGIPLTMLLVGGLSHAFNLIDGLHGLSSGIAILTSCSLGLLANGSQDAELARVCFLFAAVLVGFLVVNFPFGRLFLGDAGAYCVGYLLAWFGISLLARNPEISAWAVFLIFAWPISETLWAILRRRLRGRPVTQADRLHMHHVMLRGIEICLLGRNRRAIANPLASAMLLPFAAVSMGAGIWFAQDRMASAAVSVGVVLLFIASHILFVRFLAQRRPVRRALGQEALSP